MPLDPKLTIDFSLFKVSQKLNPQKTEQVRHSHLKNASNASIVSKEGALIPPLNQAEKIDRYPPCFRELLLDHVTGTTSGGETIGS